METNKIEQILQTIAKNVNADVEWQAKEKQVFLKMADLSLTDAEHKRNLGQKILDFFAHSRSRVALLSVCMIVFGTVALLNIYKPRTFQFTTFTPSANDSPKAANIDRDDAFRSLSNSREYISVAGENAIDTEESIELLKNAELAFEHEDFTGVIHICDKINTFLDQFVIADKPKYLDKENRNNKDKADVNANKDNEPTPSSPSDPGIAGGTVEP